MRTIRLLSSLFIVGRAFAVSLHSADTSLRAASTDGDPGAAEKLKIYAGWFKDAKAKPASIESLKKIKALGLACFTKNLVGESQEVTGSSASLHFLQDVPTNKPGKTDTGAVILKGFGPLDEYLDTDKETTKETLFKRQESAKEQFSQDWRRTPDRDQESVPHIKDTENSLHLSMEQLIEGVFDPRYTDIFVKELPSAKGKHEFIVKFLYRKGDLWRGGICATKLPD